jgi:hypothetical protein
MSDDCVGPALKECPVCGAIGLPERIAVHDCVAFHARIAVQRRHLSSTKNKKTSDHDPAAAIDSLDGGNANRTIQYPEEKP